MNRATLDDGEEENLKEKNIFIPRKWFSFVQNV